MGLKTFKIILDNTTSTFIVNKYEPTWVTGKVILVTRKTQNVQSLKLGIRGKTKVEIAQASGSGNVVFTSIENLFSLAVHPAGGEEAVQLELTKGEHCYPFRLPLPPGIPSTLREMYGRITYKVEAVVERTWKTDFKTLQYLTVVAPVELNMTPDYLSPPRTTAVGNYKVLVGSSSMTMVLMLKSRNVVPGEQFPIRVDVQNDSSVDLRRIDGKIKKITTFRLLPPEKITMVRKKVLCTFKLDAPKKKSALSSTVLLPPLNEAALNVDGSSLIDVDYMLIVTAVSSGLHKDTKIKGRVNICT